MIHWETGDPAYDDNEYNKRGIPFHIMAMVDIPEFKSYTTNAHGEKEKIDAIQCTNESGTIHNSGGLYLIGHSIQHSLYSDPSYNDIEEIKTGCDSYLAHPFQRILYWSRKVCTNNGKCQLFIVPFKSIVSPLAAVPYIPMEEPVDAKQWLFIEPHKYWTKHMEDWMEMVAMDTIDHSQSSGIPEYEPKAEPIRKKAKDAWKPHKKRK